ncbi:MAG TPA: hypothetical protein VKB80_37530 [Kofleriaceae bacterium]|nr:hypothetical protein [Kofleriaceae bacterium]
MPTIKLSALFLLLLASATGCTKYDPLYCDESMSCTDPARPYCDLAGEYPASAGVARTCIPSPFDAGMDGGGGSSADAGGRRDDARSPGDAAADCRWVALSKLAAVNSSDFEYPGSLDKGGLRLLFQRSGNVGPTGYFLASRDDPGQAFGGVDRIDALSDVDTPGLPEISSSGLEFFYANSDNSGIQSATRGSLAGSFGSPEPTGLVGGSPSLSGNGLAMYFVANDLTVRRATRTAIGQPWGTPETVLPTTGYLSVDVSADELGLLLVPNPLESPQDPILITTRSSVDESFGPLTPVNDELYVPEGVHTFARWDGNQTQMVVGVDPVDSNTGTDLYYSTCQ